MFDKFTRYSLLALVCIIFVCVSAFGQGGLTISGTVNDSNGSAIVGATVRARNAASNQETVAITDSSGKYSITGLAGGTYRVTAESSGFGEGAETVSSGSGSVTQNFSLAPGAIKDVVTVTAGKGSDRLAVETPQTVTVADAQQIEQRTPRSTFETLERAPNLGSVETSPARERPRLRGLSSSRLLIVIDGEKLNNARADPSASGAPIAVVDPSQLEAVEVVAGSGSSLYGSDAIGGVINLITKGPARAPNGDLLIGARLDGTYGRNGKVGRGSATINVSNNIFAARASYSLNRNANYKMGDGTVSLAQNIAVGNFYKLFPSNTVATTGCANTICGQSAANFPIFALSPNQEVIRGEGHGDARQIDGWFFPHPNHSFRAKFINRVDGYNGNAFSGPPYETQERFGGDRTYKKYGIRYEGLAITKFLPRVSLNYYYQQLAFPQDQYTWVNANSTLGGSYVANSNVNLTTFTGNPSIFVAGVSGATFVDNRNTIGTTGVDAQGTLQPFRGLLVTVGGGQTKDNSRDYFLTAPFAIVNNQPTLFAGVGTTLTGATSPVSNYKDNNFYGQAEFDRVKYVRLSSGFRFDNWKTEGVPGNGFPLTTEFAALNAAIPGLTANPGALSSLVSSLPSLVALAGGTGSAGSDRHSWTYNVGIVGRLPFGVNPYFRYSNSYREPAITERYLIRNFTPGLGGLASLVVGNPNLQPEKGKNYDVGVKISQRRYNFSLGYFHNKITDLLAFAPAQTYCVAPLPGLPGGFAGGCPAINNVPQLGVQINARINFANATIKGWESTGEGSIPLGELGSINPFYSLGSLHGTNGSPTALQLLQVATLYNRSDTPYKLEGSAGDFPLGNITPFRIIYGGQFLDRRGRVFVEYNVRHQNRVTRVDPSALTGTALINYGSFASLSAFTKQSLKGGYNWKTDKYKFSINAGVDNLANKLFWEHFQNAPAPGRSFVIGFTTEVFNFAKK